MDQTYDEALRARHVDLDVRCNAMLQSIKAIWDGGSVADSEIFELIEREEDYERLQIEKAQIWELLARAEAKGKGLDQKDQPRKDPAS